MIENYAKEYELYEFSQYIVQNKYSFVPTIFNSYYTLKFGAKPITTMFNNFTIGSWQKITLNKFNSILVISDRDQYHYVMLNYKNIGQRVFQFDQMHDFIEFIVYLKSEFKIRRAKKKST